MPILIYNTDDYLYEKQRDIFVLQIKNQSKVRPFVFDRDNEENKAIIEGQLKWLDSHRVEYAKTAWPELICGWNGLIYVNFSGWDDPVIAEYSAEFEDANGKSKTPEKFEMFAISYEKWVEGGGIERLEKARNDDI